MNLFVYSCLGAGATLRSTWKSLLWAVIFRSCFAQDCSESKNLRVQFNGTEFFVVAPNGTCTCLNSGFSGNGRLLDMSSNPTVQNLTTHARNLEQTVASMQTVIASLQQTISTQQNTINQLVRQQGAAVPETNLDSSSYAMSCRDYKAATPNATSGNYTLLNPSGSVYRVYCDMMTDGGGWTRVWRAPVDDLNNVTFEYVSGTISIIAKSRDMLFAFSNQANVLTQAWKFATPAAFVRTTPMSVDYCHYQWINATRLLDGFTTTRILRAGYGDFGSVCDDGCFAPDLQPGYSGGSLWGQICLKTNSIVPGPWVGTGAIGGGSTPSGFEDFPMFTGSSRLGVDYCTRSDEHYLTTNCTSSRRFTILVR